MTTIYNVNIIGGLDNNNGVLSGFSVNSNYATFSGDIFNDTDVEIVFKTKFNRVTGDAQMCYTFYDSTKTYSLCAIGLDGGKFYFEITNGSASLGDISGITTVAINTDYYIKAVRNNTTYTLYSSTNGTNWTTEGTLSNITFPNYTSVTNYIGGYAYDDNGFAIDQILDGTIDLNESYIKVGGQYVWRGVQEITKIQLRHDTAANWTSVNPILLEGEVGIETDTLKQKVGDGVTAWNNLSYMGGSGGTVDQTYDPTSTNAQSGAAIAGANFMTGEQVWNLDADKEDVFDTQSPLEKIYTSNGEGTFENGITLNPDGTTTTGNPDDYWGFCMEFGTLIPQTDYWRFNFKFKRISTTSTTMPFFAIDDTLENFVELYFSDYNLPIDTWVQCAVIHQAGASTVQFEYTINGTTTTVQNVLASGYILASNKYVNWMSLGITIIADLSWNTNYQLEPYGVRHVFTERHLGADNKAFDGQWISSKQNIITTSTSLSGSPNLPYTVQVPDDGHIYEVLLRGEVETGSSSGNFCILSIQSNQLTSDWAYVCGARTRTTSSNNGDGTIIVPISRANNNLTVRRSSNYAGNIPANGLVMLAYRRLGTNS